MFSFSLACVLGNVLVIVRYAEIYFLVDSEEAARKSARRDIFAKMLPTGFYVAAMIVSAVEFYGVNKDGQDAHRYLADETVDEYAGTSSTSHTTDVPVWLLIGATISSSLYQWIMIVFCFPGGGRHKEITVPMNIDFCIHRYGEWTMLMLGESILSLLIVDVAGGIDYYATFYTGILAVILLQYLHFRSQPHHPDEHAMRRKKEAGLGFSYFMQIYSASLIMLGTCYKMFLYEYVYEDYENPHRTLLHEMSFRYLAGGDSGALEYDAEDRQQRIANFFCTSLAIVWLCQDLMILMHKGLKDNMGRCRCKHTHKTRVVAVVLIMARVGLIVFIATLRGYVTDPLLLAVLGLCGIISQVILRMICGIVFPDDGVHTEGVDKEGNPVIVEDDEDENRWPNTTQAQAVPRNEREDPEATSHSESDERTSTEEH